MIDLGSIAGLHADNHQLHADCPTRGWPVLPLAAMSAAGQGERRRAALARYRGCSVAQAISPLNQRLATD